MQNLKMFCICIHNELLSKVKKLNYIPVGLGDDKFDDNWTMHMFTGHKYTSGRVDKEGCLATEILIKNY